MFTLQVKTCRLDCKRKRVALEVGACRLDWKRKFVVWTGTKRVVWKRVAWTGNGNVSPWKWERVVWTGNGNVSFGLEMEMCHLGNGSVSCGLQVEACRPFRPLRVVCKGNSSRVAVIKGPAVSPHLDCKAHLKQVPVPQQTLATMGSHSSRSLQPGPFLARVEATTLVTVT